jgi:hypothetical protein
MNERDTALRDKATLESGDAINLAVFADLIRADEREAVEDLLKEYDMVNSAFAKDFRARGNT